MARKKKTEKETEMEMRTVSETVMEDEREDSMKMLKADRIFMKPAEAAEFLGVSTSMLKRYRATGGGPDYHAVTLKTVRYRKCDLLVWMKKFRCKSTSDSSVRRNNDTSLA